MLARYPAQGVYSVIRIPYRMRTLLKWCWLSAYDILLLPSYWVPLVFHLRHLCNHDLWDGPIMPHGGGGRLTSIRQRYFWMPAPIFIEESDVTCASASPVLCASWVDWASGAIPSGQDPSTSVAQASIIDCPLPVGLVACCRCPGCWLHWLASLTWNTGSN